MLYSPTWSKAKKQLMDFLSPSLASVVDYHVINYRGAHDQLGRAVITVHKVEKLSMCTITAERAEYYKKWAIRRAANDFNFDDAAHNCAIQEEAHRQLKEEGIYAQYDFFGVLQRYFQAPIGESLQSTDALMKILCLLDRRVGKRTLRGMRDIM